MSGAIHFSEIVQRTFDEFEAGEIDAHTAEQRLMDLGWSTESISRFLDLDNGKTKPR